MQARIIGIEHFIVIFDHFEELLIYQIRLFFLLLFLLHDKLVKLMDIYVGK